MNVTLDSDPLAGSVLVPHVDLAGRIVTHQDRGKFWSRGARGADELGNFPG